MTGSLAVATMTLGAVLLDAFACPSTCEPDVVGLWTGLLALTILCAITGVGIHLVWTGIEQAHDRAVGVMAAAGTAALAPTGLLLIGAQSSGLEPILLPAAIAAIALVVVAARARRLAVEPVLRGRVLATVVIVVAALLAVIASM